MRESYRLQIRNGCDNCRHCFEHLDDPYEPHEVPTLHCELESTHPDDDYNHVDRKPWDTEAMLKAKHDLKLNAWSKWAKANEVEAAGICDLWDRRV